MNVTDNHFVGDFFHLDEEDSRFEIPIELPFEDGEFVFNELSSWVHRIIELASHFLTVNAAYDLIILGTDRYDRVGMEVFSDQPMNCFGIVSSVHDITIGLSCLVALSE